MSFQYFHRSGQSLPHRFTVCVDVPLKSFFEELVTPYPQKNLVLSCGFTEVHPDDNYSKVEGRRHSSKDMKERLFFLTEVEYYDEETVLKFSANLSSGIQDLYFLLKPKSKRAYLIFASLLRS